MCEKTPVVEHLNMSLRQLARADFKSLHQQRARDNETIWSLLKCFTNWKNNYTCCFIFNVSVHHQREKN